MLKDRSSGAATSHALNDNVRREDEERDGHGLQRSSLLVLVGLGIAQPGRETQAHEDGGHGLNPGVDTEADEGDQPGEETGRDRDRALGDVVDDGELREPETAPREPLPLLPRQRGAFNVGGHQLASVP